MRKKIKLIRTTRQAGQAMVEYAVVAAILAVATLAPVAFLQNMPVTEYLAKAIRAFFRAYSLLVSVF